MDKTQCEKLSGQDDCWLRESIAFEPEIESITKQVDGCQKEVMELAKGNIELKQELKQVLDRYDE